MGGNVPGSQRPRRGKQIDSSGVDFSGCEEDPETGFCCVEKLEQVTTLQKDPILECTHKNVEQCHYTYVTEFKPTQAMIMNMSICTGFMAMLSFCKLAF